MSAIRRDAARILRQPWTRKRTGMRSGYLSRMRAASACRFSTNKHGTDRSGDMRID